MTSTSEIPAHWQRTTLGELCNGDQRVIQTGPFGSQLHASDYRDTGVPVVNPTHLRLNAVDEKHLPFVSRETADQLSRHYLRKGDILISRRGDFSRYSYIGDRQDGWLCGTGCLRIRLDSPEVDNRFLAVSFSLERVQSYLSQAAVGSIMPNLNTNILRDVPLVLPPVGEQRAMADALDCISSAVNAWNSEAILECEHKAALIEQLFTHGTRGEPTKDTEIGQVPNSWQIKTLDDILIKKQYGLSIRGQQKGAVPILRMNNLVGGKVDTADLQYVDVDPELLSGFRLKRGDVLFNRTNSQGLVGKTSLFDLDTPFVFASYLIRLHIDINQALPAFVNAYLNREKVVRRIQMLATRGVSQSNVSASKLGRFPLPVPSLEEQKEIVIVAKAFDRKIETSGVEQELLEELYKAALEQLMNGQLSAAPLIREHRNE
ncbi:MAG TPA: restriction endonuclease subunit S [Candidatus Sulfotelmatobacter sp.]|nr:restriction endonuclease subunit S [Candidatus Sulfotelmatobacter sp.]